MRERGAAFHEAGHSVLGIGFGYKAAAVEIDERGGGFVHGTNEEADFRNQQDAWDWIAYNWGGAFAEARALHTGKLDVLRSHGRHDYAESKPTFAWLIAMGYALDIESAERHASSITTQHVRDHWPAIERVAAALIEKGFLSGAQVLQLTHTR